MSDWNTGGPAFPCVSDPDYADEKGMSLRDYFAAKAMASFIDKPTRVGQMGVNDYAGWTARDAYAMADAMLKARS